MLTQCIIIYFKKQRNEELLGVQVKGHQKVAGGKPIIFFFKCPLAQRQNTKNKNKNKTGWTQTPITLAHLYFMFSKFGTGNLRKIAVVVHKEGAEAKGVQASEKDVHVGCKEHTGPTLL